MFDESLVSIIFRLINFGALIGLGVYVFKRYFLHDIIEKINQEGLEKESLRHQVQELDDKSNVLSGEIVEQEQLCHKLSERVEQWHHFFNEDIERKRKENQEFHAKAVERLEKQKKFLEQELMMNEVFPQAMDQIKLQLMKDFSDPAKNKNFLADIIGHIEKRA